MPNLKDIMRLKALLRPTTPPTEQQVAHMIAQRHAAMPTQHGGLGLPPTNTPMDRAAAMGYDLPTFRGTRSNEEALFANARQVAGKPRSGTGVFMSEDPATASTYAGNMGGNVMPLMVRSQGMPTVQAGGAPWSDIAGRDTNQIAREALAAGQPGVRFQNVADPGAHLRGVPNIPETANNLTAFNPADVRSRFAAFDPLKQHSEDLMHAEGGLIHLNGGGGNLRSKMLQAGLEAFSKMTEPEKTVKAYKLFQTKHNDPNTLYPLFVNAKKPVPMNQWIDAEVGELGKTGGVKSSIGELAYRPGWHAGDLPIATHIGGKSDPKAMKDLPPDYRKPNQVWAEVEMPDVADWQTEANSRAARYKSSNPNTGAVKGEINPSTAAITDEIPVGGYYRFKTNPNMTGNWMIGGSMKVNRVLTPEEVQAINEAAGVADLPPFSPLDLLEYYNKK